MFDLRKRNRLPIVVPVVMKYCTSLGRFFSLLGEIEDSLPFDGQIATEFLPSCGMPLWFGTLLIITLGASFALWKGCMCARIYLCFISCLLGYLVGHLGNFWIFDLMFFGFRACLTVWVCALALGHCSLSRSLFIYIIVWLYYIILCIYLPRNLSYFKLIFRCSEGAACGLGGAVGVPWEISSWL